MNEERVRKLLCNAVAKFGLAMERHAVLTEAATGYFSLTPLLAALGGARKVYALARDSRFGSANQVADDTLAMAGRWGLEKNVDMVFSREDERIGDADIITNLGFVRPIDAELIGRLKPTAVVSLMWETWEFRREDLDLEFCQSQGIPVLGTNEHHSDLQLFGYIGHVVLKLLYELDLEVFKSSVVIVGGGEFALESRDRLIRTGAFAEILQPNDLKSSYGRALVAKADALVLLEHRDRRELIGDRGLIAADELKMLNPTLAIAHVCGGVNQTAIERVGLRYLPRVIAPAGYMSASTSYVGPRPVIELHAAGLKVGQVLAEAVSSGMAGIAAERWTLQQCNYAQGFEGRH